MDEEDIFVIRTIIKNSCPFAPSRVLLKGFYTDVYKIIYCSQIRCYSNKSVFKSPWTIRVNSTYKNTLFPEIIKKGHVEMPTVNYMFYVDGKG